MQMIIAGSALDTILQDFVARYPRLQTRSGSFGRCKFMTYELALHLRRRGVRASVIHCQTLAKGHRWLETAHNTWKEKPRKEWSHYVLRVGSKYIDMTGRQFDPEAPHPQTYTRPQLSEAWETVEVDDFINKQLDEVLRAQGEGNRTATKYVRKSDITSRDADGVPQQQVLAPPVA